MTRYAQFIVRHRVWVLIFTGLITLSLGFRLKDLYFEVDPARNLPQGHPYIAAGNEIEDVFGGKNVVVVAVVPKDGDIFRTPVLEKIKSITEAIINIPGAIKTNVFSIAAKKAKAIKGTEGGMTVSPLMERIPGTTEEMERLKTNLFSNPLFIDAIISRDGKAAAILADFKLGKDLPGFPAIEDRVRAVIEKYKGNEIDIYIAGLPIGVSWVAKYSERLMYLLPLAVVIVGIILFFAFRTFQGVVVPIATAILSVVWSMGIMSIFHIPLDGFTATTPILILALASGHSVQILKRYYEELEISGNNEEAVIKSVAGTGRVLVIAGLIAAAGFFSLVTFKTVTIQTFGIFTALGILSAMILEMIFIPALRSLLTPRKGNYSKNGEGSRERSLPPFARGRGIFFISILILSLFGIFQLKVDNSLKKQFFKNSILVQDDSIVNKLFGGTNTLTLLIEGKYPDTIKQPEVLKEMEGLQKYLDGMDGVGKTISIVDYIKMMNKAMNADDPSYYSIPRSQELVAQYFLLYSMSGDPQDFDSYVDNDYRRAVIQVFLHDDSTAYVEHLIKEVQNYVTTHFDKGVKVKVAGSIAQTVAMNEVMVEGKIRNILMVAAVIFIGSMLALRSLVGAIFVVIPLFLSVISSFGLMGWLSVNLEITTASITGMIVGIGADFAIYFLFRLREEFLKSGVLEESLERTLLTSGRAILFVAMAIGIGYLTLTLSGFMFYIKMGGFIAFAMLMSSMATLTLLPYLILKFKPEFVISKPKGD